VWHNVHGMDGISALLELDQAAHGRQSRAPRAGAGDGAAAPTPRRANLTLAEMRCVCCTIPAGSHTRCMHTVTLLKVAPARRSVRRRAFEQITGSRDSGAGFGASFRITALMHSLDIRNYAHGREGSAGAAATGPMLTL